MKKILVVENNKSIKMQIRNMLDSEHFRIIEATNGWSGLELANEHNPDLIISNINLPQLTGIQFYQQIKKFPVINKIPFLFISSYQENGNQNSLSVPKVDFFYIEELSASGFMDCINTTLFAGYQ
jgi:CheY-like chemotaxis protein